LFVVSKEQEELRKIEGKLDFEGASKKQLKLLPFLHFSFSLSFLLLPRVLEKAMSGGTFGRGPWKKILKTKDLQVIQKLETENESELARAQQSEVRNCSLSLPSRF
jgi:hypothetical protein